MLNPMLHALCQDAATTAEETDRDSTSFKQRPQASISDSRIVSALELLLGAFIVIGHNVLHVVPNEVPILFVVGLLSIRLRDGQWSTMGLKRPASWVRIVQISLAAAGLRIVLGEFVIDPLTGNSGLRRSPPLEWNRLPVIS